MFAVQAPLKKLLKDKDELEEDVPENEELDWWSKYYASLEELEKQVTYVLITGVRVRGRV